MAAPATAAQPDTAPPTPGVAVPSVPADDSAAHRARLQRRPTGAPPPLPHPITIRTTAWLLLTVIILVGAFLFSNGTAWLQFGDRDGTWLLRLLADVRTPWLTDVARSVNAIGTGWGVTALALSVVALTMIFRRWRHLLVFIGSLVVLEIVGAHWIYDPLSRPRPYGVRIIGDWGGFSAASVVIFVFTFFLVGAVYCLVVPGGTHTQATIVVAVLVAVLGMARLYLQP